MKTSKLFLTPLLCFAVWEAVVWIAAAHWVSGSNFLLVGLLSTAFAVVALVVYLSIARLFVRRVPAAASEASPRAVEPSERPPLDTAPLVELMREADRRLSKHGKGSLADLPLYLLAGAPGAGKTATFLAADLSSQLIAGQAHRESTVLPTSICNFWYASGSVFVEAGGRFFTEDIRDWRVLTERLCSDRSVLGKLSAGASRNTGIKGVLWFCDITGFLGVPDPGRIGNLARKVKERLLVLAQVMGSSFPVYVVFTKADSLPHFGNFFQRFPESDERQIFGVTLPASDLPDRSEIYADAQTRRLLEPFNALYLELAAKRLRLLSRETDKNRKGGIYEFPREVKRVRDSVLQFLVEAFRPNPLQPSPLLRGFYFTGVREVPAAAIPAAFSTVESASTPKTSDATVMFQADMPQPGKPEESTQAGPSQPLVQRWTFVVDLFQRIVLRDPLGRAAALHNTRRDTRKRLLLATFGLAVLAVTCCFAVSWRGNLRLLTNLERAGQIDVAGTSTDGLPSSNELRALDSLHQALSPVAEYREYGAPWHLRWGLYTGNRVYPRGYEAYFQLFQHYFLTRTENVFSSRLKSLSSSNGSASYNTIYDTVKAYRMTTSGECKPDPAFLVPVLLKDWQGSQPLSAERLALAEQQVRFYAVELTRNNPYHLSENPQLIADGREFLASFGGVDRLLRAVIETANKPPRRAARVEDIAPNFRQVLTGPGEVQAAFTLDAWSLVEQKLREPGQFSLGETCVVTMPSPSLGQTTEPQLAGQIKALYLRLYLQAWKHFLASTAVQPFRSRTEAARSLELLADNRSPLLAALFLAAENTNFVPGTAPEVAPALVKTKQPPPIEKGILDPAQEFARIFQPVRQVVRTGNRDRLIDDSNQGYINALGEMQQAMDRLARDSTATPDLTLHQQAQAAAEKGLDCVRTISQRFNINGSEGVDNDVKRLLETPFRNCQKFIITDPSKVGRDRVTAASKAFCARLSSLEHAFPFDPLSETDATPEQVGAIFAPPAGALFAFEQQLDKLIVRQDNYWVQNPDLQDPKLSPAFLAFLNRLVAISGALYADGSSHLRMQYELAPLLSPGIDSVTAEVDGQQLSADSAEVKPALLNWPGPNGQQSVLIRVKAGANIPFASYAGLWSIFRLIDDADPRAHGSRIIELSKVRRGHGRPESVLDASDKPIKVRLQLVDANGKADIFDKSFFPIQCPGSVFE